MVHDVAAIRAALCSVYMRPYDTFEPISKPFSANGIIAVVPVLAREFWDAAGV